MKSAIRIGKRKIGETYPVYVIAELSANHNQNFEEAEKLIHAAKKAGADAIKLQTYTPDTLTLNNSNKYFRVGKGTIWEGKNLYSLYEEAFTPWEWQPKLKKIAEDLKMDLFSTPFDVSAVDFLESMEVPAYKVASFELVDIPLISKIAKTGKPVIMSTGMASLAEIEEAVQVMRAEGNDQIALLKCTSAYPAQPDEMNLRTIPHLAQMCDVPVGISDHTLGISIPVAAVTLGACIVEKHFTRSRNTPGPDSTFSLEPQEFKEMVEAIRVTEKALGTVNYAVTKHEKASRAFRRSLFIVDNIAKGERFTADNIRSIRPGYGLAPKFIVSVIGKTAKTDLKKGTPLSWDMIC